MKDNEKYCAYTYLRYAYPNEIIQKYLNGESTAQIANFYNLTDDHLIAALLRELGVQIRPVGYTSKTNQLLFKDINNELTAYVLGLITADGSIGENYSISIDLQTSDKALLDEINKRLYNNSGYILTYQNSQMNRLSINGKQICKQLTQYGVIPKKTYTLKSLASLPDELMPHYLRGLFDGDGVCSFNRPYLRIGYCSYNIEFVENFQDYIVQKLKINKNQLFNTGNCWQCSWSKRQDLEKIYHYLYDNATIFLSRKKNKIFSYLYDNTEVTSQIAKG